MLYSRRYPKKKQEAKVEAPKVEAPKKEEDIDEMTKKELIAHAKENNIDLGDARNKSEILEIIKG